MALKTGSIEKADFVFMFCSVGYDQRIIVKYVYDFCGGAPLCGCSGEGTIAGFESDESNFSVAVMAIRSDETPVHQWHDRLEIELGGSTARIKRPMTKRKRNPEVIRARDANEP